MTPGWMSHFVVSSHDLYFIFFHTFSLHFCFCWPSVFSLVFLYFFFKFYILPHGPIKSHFLIYYFVFGSDTYSCIWMAYWKVVIIYKLNVQSVSGIVVGWSQWASLCCFHSKVSLINMNVLLQIYSISSVLLDMFIIFSLYLSPFFFNVFSSKAELKNVLLFCMLTFC